MVKRGSLVPVYVGFYEILKQVRKVGNEWKLHSELASVHLVFHVSTLKKCIGDPGSSSQKVEEQRGCLRKSPMEEPSC